MLICIALILQMQFSAPAQTSISESLRKVENRYNNIRTLQLDFEQTISFTAQPSAKRTESGVLFLRKPGRMRWEYRKPAEKLFLSDGKDVYYYSAAAHRVEKSKIKETDDMRAPLAFLIGRLDFQRDFREFRYRTENGEYHVVAAPKSDKAPYTEVEFIVTTDFTIRELAVKGHDRSLMRFRFSLERANVKFPPTQFTFQAPAGIPIVDVQDDGSEAK